MVISRASMPKQISTPPGKKRNAYKKERPVSKSPKAVNKITGKFR
jgi:hypothetical protein